MIKTCQETISISRNYRKHAVWTTAVLQLSWNSPLECTHCEGKHFAAQPTRCLVSETESMIISKCYGPLSFSFSFLFFLWWGAGEELLEEEKHEYFAKTLLTLRRLDTPSEYQGGHTVSITPACPLFPATLKNL